MFTNVHEALVSRIPETTEWFKNSYTAHVTRVFEKYGPTLKTSWKDKTARDAVNSVKEFVKRIENNEYAPDWERVEKLAAQRAERLCLQWEEKINGKVEQLKNVVLVYDGNLSYRITGKRGAIKVRIEQQMTLCANRHGTIYNQFPARIYVDDVFTPEAEYKAMFGETKPVRPIVGYKSRRNPDWNSFTIYPVAADGKKTDGEKFYVVGYKEVVAKLRELNAKLGK